MAFRLPASLAVGRQYLLSPNEVEALEESLPPRSRVLVGLVFSERYDGFESDCVKAEAVLKGQAGLSTWPEYPYFVTPDPDGQPVAWVSYMSSPAWWTLILLLLGGMFLFPIISAAPFWIIDKMFPGTSELLMLGLLMGGMAFLMPMLAGKEGK